MSSQRPTLEAAVERYGSPGPRLWVIFLLVSLPGVLNVWHLTVYVFLGRSLPHWCTQPQLEAAKWTPEEIRNFTSPGTGPTDGCKIYSRNYTQFAAMPFSRAVKMAGNGSRPRLTECHSGWDYEGNSIVSEWDLVCDRAALRSTAQMFVALGKFLGALTFGCIADRWGRKKALVIAYVTYIIAGPAAAFCPYYAGFMLARTLLGMAGSGSFNCGFTLLTEVCAAKHRTLLGILYNMPYPLGMMLLSLIAYYEQENWRRLQLIISLPAVLLLLNCWILPESPRWLLTQGRKEDAWKIVRQADESRPASEENMIEVKHEAPTEKLKWYRRALASASRLVTLFRHSELRRRLFISHFTWCVCALTYYALALNAENFTADRYQYIAVAGAVEAVSYLVPIPLLRCVGRRHTSSLMFLMSGVALMSIMAIPQGTSFAIIFVAMAGRLCIGAVYSVIILHTSEMFPTEIRNTAIGTSSTMSHVGSLAAPYLVDLLGVYGWYIPSTVCGALVLLAGFLVLLLPETKDKPLCNTVDEMEKTPRNCCPCC